MGMAKCGDCLHFGVCSNYVDAEETFPEIEGGCTAFKSKDDFVEVVRCKDCDWYREHEGSICVNPKCGKSWYGCPVPPEHFCSYGERKDNEN